MLFKEQVPHPHYRFYPVGTGSLNLFEEYVLCASSQHGSICLPTINLLFVGALVLYFCGSFVTSCLNMRMNSSANTQYGTGPPYSKKELTPSLTFKTHTC